MTKQLKRLAAVLFIALSAMCVNAATPIYNVLCINRTDGITEHLQLHADLRFGLSPEGNIRITHPQVTVEIPREDVKDFTVIEGTTLGEPYDGDYSGIDETAAHDVKISITPDAISVSGAEGIVLYDLKGAKVASADSVIKTSSLAKGVYIVKAGKTTLKITL